MKYKMLLTGFLGVIKKTEIVEIEHMENGMAVVFVGDRRDTTMISDLEEVKDV